MAKRKSRSIKAEPVSKAADDGPNYDDEQALVELVRAGMIGKSSVNELGKPGVPSSNPYPDGIPQSILARPGGDKAGFHHPVLGAGLPTVPEIIASIKPPLSVVRNPGIKSPTHNADNDVGSAAMETLTEDDGPFLEKAKRETSLELLHGRPREGKHRVTLLRDSLLEYPELWLAVYVAGDRYEEAQFAEMLTRARCRKAKTIDDADFVVFTGGPDVDPLLYGEKPHVTTHISPERDTADINLYLQCLEKGIPMLGICRGAQFISVMQGGKLIQDIDNHQGSHSMWDISRSKMIRRVSSVHHQMVMNNTSKGMEIIGTSNVGRTRWLNPKDKIEGSVSDIEAFFYRDICAIGIQGHPEYKGYEHFTQWTLELINELIVLNPDIDWVGEKGNCHRRIKPDLLAMRNGPLIELSKPKKGK